MTSYELDLWNKIKSFQFDKPNIKLTFAKRLAKENAISLQFTNQIVEEYRKFIFLCCVSKQEVSPSHWVDQAWHLHLTYTKSYWVDLCRNTIDRDLHHNPTEGGQEEDAKFKNLYEDTLELYELYFSRAAPRSVWPAKNEKPESSKVEIDKGNNWIIPKNFGFYKQTNSLAIIAVVFLALLLGCSADAGAIAIIFVVVLIVALVISIFRNSSKARGANSSGYSSGCSSGCSGGSADSDSHSHGSDGHAGAEGGSDSSDGGGGDSGCSSSGCSGGCGGGGD